MHERRGGRATGWLVLWAIAAAAVPAAGQATDAEDGKAIYEALKRFDLSDKSVAVSDLTLKRDRGVMTFSGQFYLEVPVAGRVRGAVFMGRGTFRAEPPNSAFERAYVKRMLDADVVESTFQTAVLRFSDNTVEQLGTPTDGAAPPPSSALDLAREFNARQLKETGANFAARLLVSIVNQESPGVFLAEFDKGKRGRFCFLLDPQGRVLASTFGINDGEKGLIFRYERGWGSEEWMAFYSEEDYQRGRVEYTDAFDLVRIPHYRMEVDLREPTKRIALTAQIQMEAAVNGLRAIPMALSEDLSEFDNMRLKKAMRIKSARLADGSPLEALQEDWEGGLTLLLPKPRAQGEQFTVVAEIEGDFMFEPTFLRTTFYPLINGEWYPRHGYLTRSTYDLTFRHKKKDKVASAGVRVREEPAPDNPDEGITQWKVEQPVDLVTFGVGRFERHEEKSEMKDRPALSVEFYSLPGSQAAIKEDFILAELGNCVRYFSALFGDYQYPQFRAMFHPRAFGQGFATMLMIPNTDRTSKYTFSFIAHETAHQWWGNIVAWRSYRDQWLSEGFAEYSGILYTRLRDKPGSARDLVRQLRQSLKDPPATDTGIAKGRLVDVGPIILGHRLSSRETLGAYTTLIYNKGALVLRMLHFLFTDPATGNGQPFFDMMSDFVNRHRNGSATTESFRAVANEHFARTPIAQKYGLKDLNWFFSQWVYQAALPSYRMQYGIENQADGSVIVRGSVYQDNAPENWFMPLPVEIRLNKDQVARGTVHALGPVTPFAIRLPRRPEKVELDPDDWILSEKTETKSGS